ncbi:MAG: hypothetical protein ACM3VS_09755 [Candidatus Dadabacteria bacterium]
MIEEQKNEGDAVYLFNVDDALAVFKLSPLVISDVAPGIKQFRLPGDGYC